MRSFRSTVAMLALVAAPLAVAADAPRSAAEQTHWSFGPVRRPEVPALPPASRGHRNEIDPFIGAKLTSAGLSPSPEAGRRTLIRRLTFDLIGLPPSPEEVDAFLGDSDPLAYEHLVDRLLASPHYGERWARHWLDVVRFAESDGFETNQPRPNAWPYRDYVIRAFNDDTPYDRFVMEQLAGDVLGEDAATGFLVGGAADRVLSPDPVLTAQQRADELHDIVGTTASAFLGLTVNCARCHDHKFDPIPARDYYAFKACFAAVRHAERPLPVRETAERREREQALRRELSSLIARIIDRQPLASVPASGGLCRPRVTSEENIDRFAPVTARIIRFTIHESNTIEPCLDELEVFTNGPEPRNVALASTGATATSSGDYAGNPAHRLSHLNDGRYGNEFSWISNESGRGWVQLTLPREEIISRVHWSRDRTPSPVYRDRVATRYEIAVSRDGLSWQTVATSDDRQPFQSAPTEVAGDSELTQLVQRRVQLSAELSRLTGTAMAYLGKFTAPDKVHVLERGDPMQPRVETAPGALEAFGGGWRLLTNAPDPARRLALACWIASAEHPLTARVLVNRLWHYHFGTGLVETPSDFGRNGARPSHPELLDWLASEFIARGWSLKAMHRLICNSATYRQEGLSSTAGLRLDAGDRLLWRFPPRRLEAEAVRDAMLALSGALDRRAGGPGFDLFEPNTNYVKVYTTKTRFGPDDFRRMIYQTKPRVELDSLFGAFDCPDAGQTAPRRTVSTTPLQALGLLNSDFAVGQFALFAARLERESGSNRDAQITRAYQLAFGRAPDPVELTASRELVAGHGLPALCRALVNANEFITIY